MLSGMRMIIGSEPGSIFEKKGAFGALKPGGIHGAIITSCRGSKELSALIVHITSPDLTSYAVESPNFLESGTSSAPYLR